MIVKNALVEGQLSLEHTQLHKQGLLIRLEQLKTPAQVVLQAALPTTPFARATPQPMKKRTASLASTVLVFASPTPIITPGARGSRALGYALAARWTAFTSAACTTANRTAS